MFDRYSSTGVMVGGIILGAIGAIIAWAVTATSKDLDVHRVGIILLVVGIAIFLVGLAVAVMNSTGSRSGGSGPGDPPVPPRSRY